VNLQPQRTFPYELGFDLALLNYRFTGSRVAALIDSVSVFLSRGFRAVVATVVRGKALPARTDDRNGVRGVLRLPSFLELHDDFFFFANAR
jgi:hypothetical protein